MPPSSEDLPGNFNAGDTVPTYEQKGLRLSNHIYNTNTLLRLRRVSFNGKDIKLPNGTTETSSSFIADTKFPTLYLDINPKSLSISMNKASNVNVYTRAGFIPQFWGDELDVISVQSTSAAFVHTTDGLTRQLAGDTTGYKNFMSLLMLYKNNGASFRDYKTATGSSGTDRNTIAKIKAGYNKSSKGLDLASSSRKVIDTRYVIELRYSNLLCYGLFDSFTYSETTDRPFHFDYSFEFTVLFYNTDNDLRVEGHLKR